MKRILLLPLILLPLIAGCSHSVNSTETKSSTDLSISNSTSVSANASISSNTNGNVNTRNYKNVQINKLHPEIEEGYTRINSVLINSEFSVSVEESTTYLYKLSCKNKNDSFQTHRITCDDDGFYYAEISDNQHEMIPNGFSVLKNNNYSGSSVEISIEEVYQCFTYTELYYSESKQMVKIIDFDHVIPGLDESRVNSLVGKSIDYYVYVDESGIKTLNHGNLPFSSELIIKYIDVSNSSIQIH